MEKPDETVHGNDGEASLRRRSLCGLVSAGHDELRRGSVGAQARGGASGATAAMAAAVAAADAQVPHQEMRVEEL